MRLKKEYLYPFLIGSRAKNLINIGKWIDFYPMIRYPTNLQGFNHMSEIDNIFDQQIIGVQDFEFNQRVADVFDDMVSRSVPFYGEIHRILVDLTNYIFESTETPVIYDLGCSTGTTLSILSKKLHELSKTPSLIGVDNSGPMVAKAKEKLDGCLGDIKVTKEDLLNFKFDKKADLIIMNYTLQFIPPEKREKLLKNIFEALKPGATFILSEKINPQRSEFFDLITDLYYDFKKEMVTPNLRFQEREKRWRM